MATPFPCTDIFNYKLSESSSHPFHTSGSQQTAASTFHTAVWAHKFQSNQVTQFLEVRRPTTVQSHFDVTDCRQCEVIIPIITPIPWANEWLWSISRSHIVDYKCFFPLCVGSGQWSQVVCCHAISLYSRRSSSENKVGKRDNPSWRLSWQHLSTLFATVFSPVFDSSNYLCSFWR